MIIGRSLSFWYGKFSGPVLNLQEVHLRVVQVTIVEIWREINPYKRNFIYHLESRWRNSHSHVLVYHGPLQIASFWEWRG